MTIFHRIEKYGDNHIEGPFLELSFKTEYRGYWQCRVTNTGIDEFRSEPSLQLLKGEEQTAIKEIAGITFYFTHGEWPKALNSFDT